MMISKHLSLLCALMPTGLAFPNYMHEGFGDTIWSSENTDIINNILSSFRQHPDLMRKIELLHLKQETELNLWKHQGKPYPFMHSVDSDDTNQWIHRETNNHSVEGLTRFPENDFPFIAPGPTDQRGPCPGMNTLANHGYLPRNGIVTAGQVFEASDRVFNMAVDLAALLISGAVSLNGDIQTLTFSIGGADRRTNSLGTLGGILGTETGLDGHGRVNEGDASATRCDFYLCKGDNHNLQPDLFLQLRSLAQSTSPESPDPLLTLPVMQTHFHNRYHASRSTNPNFYFVPPSAIVVMGATYFYPGFFTNGTYAPGTPTGLNGANLESVSSFVGAKVDEAGNVIYVPERIPPQGWYRRGVPMTLAEALAGILSVYSIPNPVEFGGNAGSVNSFVPGPGLLPQNTSNPNQLGCFLYNALYADFFGEFDNILFALESTVNTVLGILGPSLKTFLSIGCTPNFPDETLPNAYGGAKTYLAKMAQLPGAPKKQGCLIGGLECNTKTNVYGGV